MTVISGGEIDPSGLSTCQLDKLIAYVRIMNDLNHELSLDELVNLGALLLRSSYRKVPFAGGTPGVKRDTEYIYDDSLPELPYESALYKKDAENVGETRLGRLHQAEDVLSVKSSQAWRTPSTKSSRVPTRRQLSSA